MTATYQYAYDPVGNMTASTETITSTTVVTRTFNAANQLQTSDDGSGETTYTYDDNGNLTETTPPGSTGATRYSFDQRNLLITSTLDSGAGYEPLADFAYDGSGNRLRQIDHSGGSPVTTLYTNDVVGLSQVLVADAGPTEVYNLFGLDLVHQDEGATNRTLLADGLGSVRTEMVGSVVVATSTYSPYGTPLSRNGSSGSVYGYTGEQEDGATGLLYLRARYYNPYLNRFLSADRIVPDFANPQSLNRHSYAQNDPINWVDPSGVYDRVKVDHR